MPTFKVGFSLLAKLVFINVKKTKAKLNKIFLTFSIIFLPWVKKFQKNTRALSPSMGRKAVLPPKFMHFSQSTPH